MQIVHTHDATSVWLSAHPAGKLRLQPICFEQGMPLVLCYCDLYLKAGQAVLLNGAEGRSSHTAAEAANVVFPHLNCRLQSWLHLCLAACHPCCAGSNLWESSPLGNKKRSSTADALQCSVRLLSETGQAPYFLSGKAASGEDSVVRDSKQPCVICSSMQEYAGRMPLHLAWLADKKDNGS